MLGIIWAAFWYKWFRNELSEFITISKEEVNKIESERSVVPMVRAIPLNFILKNKNVICLMLMCHLFFYSAAFFPTGQILIFRKAGE